MRQNFQTWLNSLTNDDGSGTTGGLLNASWFTDQMDVIGGDLDDIDDEITALQNVGFLSGYDSVLYAYKDTDTITIQSGGQFTVSDDSTVIKVAANTDLKLSTGRSMDCAAEAANTLYYIWGGLTSLGATAFYFHTSATAMPSELAKGKRIRGAVRNDNSTDIMPFIMTPTQYWYNVSINTGGSDVTEVLDASIGTSWTDVNCAGFLPPGSQMVYVQGGASNGLGNGYPRVRPNGASTDGMTLSNLGAGIAVVDANGIFEIKLTQTLTTYLSVAGYEL